MADGTGRLGGGAQQLADGLTDGAAQIPDDTAAQRTARADALATPVAIDDDDVAPAASLGEGFAPLFIPLALFVGGSDHVAAPAPPAHPRARDPRVRVAGHARRLPARRSSSAQVRCCSCSASSGSGWA